MPLDLAQLETRLGVIDWRDTELAAITEQLEAAFPALVTSIQTEIEVMSTFQIVRAQADPRKLTAKLVAPWAAEQSRIAMSRAETELSALIAALKNEGRLAAVTTALPALAGMGMLAASVLALPALVSYATITTTSLMFFSTSAISVPLLLAGGTALAGLSLVGVNVVGRTKGKLRDHLAARVVALARTAVFGTGQALDTRCLLNDLQAAVLVAGQTKLAEAA